MSTYMLQAAYTTEALKTLSEKPENRGEIVAAQIERLGGRLTGFYHSFGEYFDAVVICELPDEIAAQALALSVSAAGHLKSIKTTRLISVNEAMDVMRKAGSAPYRKPGSMR